MGRLSVSLSDDQEGWIEEKSEDFNVSKGKVIRECIDEIREGSSLFTTSVNPGPSGERIESLETRIENLERLINSQLGDTKSDPPLDQQATDNPDPDPDTSVTEVRTPGSASMSTQATEDPEHTPSDSTTPISADVSVPSTEEQSNSGKPPENLDPVETSGDAPTGDSFEDEGSDDSTDQGLNQDQSKAPRGVDSHNLDQSDPEDVETYLFSNLPSEEKASVVYDCWFKLRKRGTVHVRSLQNEYSDVSLGYSDADEWWTDAIQPIFDSLPGVDPPEGGGNLYRFKY